MKRQRNNEYYARNKDEILKRHRQARGNKQDSTTELNDQENSPHTPLKVSANINGLETDTQTLLSISIGNDDALLHTPLLIVHIY